MGYPITIRLRRCVANRIDRVHAAANQSGGTEQQSGNAKIGHKDDVDRWTMAALTVSDFDDAAAVAGTGHRSSAEHFVSFGGLMLLMWRLCGDRARADGRALRWKPSPFPFDPESGGRGELRAGQTVQAVFGCGDRSGGAAFDVRAAAKSGKLQALAVAAARGRGAAFGCKSGAGHVWLARKNWLAIGITASSRRSWSGGVYLDRGGVTGRGI